MKEVFSKKNSVVWFDACISSDKLPVYGLVTAQEPKYSVLIHPSPINSHLTVPLWVVKSKNLQISSHIVMLHRCLIPFQSSEEKTLVLVQNGFILNINE